MSLLKKLFEKNPKIDFSQSIFFVRQFRQKNYDREIDEGMSSGMKRYATLDVTKLSKKQARQVIGELIEEVQDFSLCKLVQLAGFTKKDKRYLILSGESHIFYEKSTKDVILNRMKSTTKELPVEYLKAHVTPLIQGELYKPTNLGPYGSTGNPCLGISQHPDAQKLREKGIIK
ncbi:hypothetical protein KAJ87_01415 [Candidatus Pacearchaeota archaeon]|nr:hypothetical protein [Candidatus Pacearchaeota archaeon]